MSTGDLIDDDPDVGAAVSKILARGPAAWGDGEEREDARENRDDRDPHEMANDGEMDTRPESEEAEEETQAADQAAEDGGEQFLEIPGETEDAEPVKIPLSEAAEAVKQIRQMNGDIAAAVIRAETEAQEKHERITTGMLNIYEKLETEAKTALHLMDKYLPQAPNRVMLDERSEHYDPQRYYAMKAYHDEFVEYRGRVAATIEQASKGQEGVLTEAQKAEMERETGRIKRYIPDWSDAKKTEIVGALKAKYGVTDEEMGDIVSHKAWRIMSDLADFMAKQTKAPEVRKAVQEKAAKIVNGKMPTRDQGTGRFVSRDRDQLRKTGSETDAARLFMKSGLTKSLL